MGPELYRLMHKTLHGKATEIEIQGTSYPVEETNKGLRYIRWETAVFAQQDPKQKTSLAQLAKHQSISRIIRSGAKWGWISDTEIADPLLK